MWARHDANLRSMASEALGNQARSKIDIIIMSIVAGVLANDINAFLFGMFAARILFRAAPRPLWRYMLASSIGVGIAVGLAEAGKIYSVWPGSDTFPSGHETFGASVCACLYQADRRLLSFCVFILALLAWALVNAHYHDWRDVAGGAALGTAVTSVVLKYARLYTANES